MGRGLSPQQEEILKLAYAKEQKAAAMEFHDTPNRYMPSGVYSAEMKRRSKSAVRLAEVLHHVYGWEYVTEWRMSTGGKVFHTNTGKHGDRVSAQRSVRRLFDRGLLERHGANNTLFHITDAGRDVAATLIEKTGKE